MTRENATKTVAVRFTPTEHADIGEYIKDHGFATASEWIRTLVRQAMYGTAEGESSASRPLTIVDQLKYNEEAADLIYQLVADKLRLSDLRAELAAFSLQKPAESISELEERLRVTASRIAATPQDRIVQTEYVVMGEVEVTLDWNHTWSLSEFLALDIEERKVCSFFMLVYTGFDPELPDYFWALHRNTEFQNYLNRQKDGGMDEFAVTVYGASSSTPNKAQNMVNDLDLRVVQMMRYVARDSNIGNYRDLFDKHLRYYTVTNTGKLPPGIPVQFTFGWTSDNRNSGSVYYRTKDDIGNAAVEYADTTFRPVVCCRWHYTSEEDGKATVSFDEDAVPKRMRQFLLD